MSATTAEESPRATTRKIEYNDGIVRMFVGASIMWSIVALLLGVIVATQLATFKANLHPMLAYGRLRPLHTNAAIFAFVGNMMFAGVYYSTQRLVKARISDVLAKIHFWGWQGIIVAAAVTLPLGLTQGKEYAELEWPIDIAIAVIWVVFALNFFLTLYRRTEKHLYVAIWFYIATIVTVAMLHIVNSLAIPVAATKSYSIFGGAQDALVQWWYGHNAVAFFLTTPILGIMYYFVPKAAERPVYSYRLSVIHFWALVFLYIWAGPHHLLNTALPDWAQSLGMIFSVMLWAPSWGGMINGLLTLRGAWHKLRTDPVLKFFAAGITFYGMSTFEGPLLSIRSVSGLAHYTDWIIGHVHEGALGWNGFMAVGMFYWIIPRLYGTKLNSTRLADVHFWLATIGILIYVISMWVAGITQGLMWRAVNPDGSLRYQSFIETVVAIRPLYWTRMVGGLLYLGGMLIMVVNIVRTVRSGKPVDGHTTVVVEEKKEPEAGWASLIFGKPVVISAVIMLLAWGVGIGDAVTGIAWITLLFIVGAAGIIISMLTKGSGPTWHRLLEGRALLFTVLTVVAVVVGGAVQIIPSILVKPKPEVAAQTRMPTGLEIEGRDIYIREGCYTCHSQMIRPFTFEAQRFGDPSLIGESRYDHPFQWGSKRTGPDLAREGVRNGSAAWHYSHFRDPRAVSPESNMPSYAHFLTNKVNFGGTSAKLSALSKVGVPFTDLQIQNAAKDAEAQAKLVAAELAGQGIKVEPDTEIVAIIAYIQSLGKPPSATTKEAPAPILTKLEIKRVDDDVSKPDPDAAYWASGVPGTVTLTAQPMVTPRPETTTTDSVTVVAVHDAKNAAFLLKWKDTEVSEAGRLGEFSDAFALEFPLNSSGPLPPVMMGSKGQPVHLFHWRAQYQRDAERGKPEMKDLYPNMSIDMYPMEFANAPGGSKAEGEKFSPGVAVGNPQSYQKTGVDEIVAEGFSTSAVQEGHGSTGRGTWKDGEWRLVIVRPLVIEGGSELKSGADGNIGFAAWQGGKGEVGSRKCVTMQWTPFHVE
ncbi:MAG: cytochrome-c oxidase, cbb3-type subunit I [Polyangiaceae bacterium]